MSSSSTHQHLLLLLLLLLTFCSVQGDEFLKREHTLVKPYQDAGFGIPNWDFLGSVMVTSSHVRLTPDVQGQNGAIWNKVPARMRNWELQVQFKVSGSGKSLFGDGFALWYARDRMKSGPVFGSLDYFSGLAIIADTYSNHNGPNNHKHPYLSAMVNNGSLHYDHDRDGTPTMLGGCEVKFRGVDHNTFIAVRYENDVLTIFHDLSNKNEWKECVRIEGVVLPTGYFFGASASTGDLSDNHDIISMRVLELDASEAQLREDRSKLEPSSIFFSPPRDHMDDPPPSSMSGIKLFFLLLLGVVGCVVCVVIGVMMYQKQQDNSRKRFY